MRSGNGRHRRPRQAPAFVVTAGVTGAGLTLPLFAASAAHAADSATWDKVAQCESGGLWSANSGNGYYGGLQLTLESWKSHGGTEYAARPDLASRSEQIAVAEKILDTLGPDAWPSCSMSSGLTEESTQAPDVDPGLPGDELGLPTAPSTNDGSTASPEASPSPSATPGTPPSGAPSDESGEPEGTATPDTPDTPQDEASPGDDTPSAPAAGDSGKDAGQDPADGDGRHRGPADTRGGETEHPSRGRHGRPGLPADSAGEHTVRPGDTLSAVAAENHVAGGWPALYAANRQTVGDDPDLILPGQVLHWGGHSAS
jgi:LysM repeat protein